MNNLIQELIETHTQRRTQLPLGEKLELEGGKKNIAGFEMKTKIVFGVEPLRLQQFVHRISGLNIREDKIYSPITTTTRR